MKNSRSEEIIYQLNVRDLQHISDRVLKRPLTNKEVALVRDSVGDYIDWVQAIEHAIYKHVAE